MRGMRRRAAFALLLLSLCVPAMHVSAEAGGGQAEYTVEYIANVNHFFTLLGKMFFTSYGKEFFTSLSKQIFTS